MAWDRELYRRDVLDVARRAGNVPPADLYVRYGLCHRKLGPGAFDDQIEKVTGYWQQLKGDRVLGALASRLVVEHAAMVKAGPLTAKRLDQLHQAERQKRLALLDRQAAIVAAGATHVDPATVKQLAGAVGGLVTDGEARAALVKAGVTVVEAFPSLAPRHPKQSMIAGYVQQLGRWLSAEVVLGDDVGRGFRILGGFQLADGRRLDAKAMATALASAGALPHNDPSTAPTQRTLGIMRTEATAGNLDALLLSEVVEHLRTFARTGLCVQRAVAEYARAHGLAEDEAGLLAAAVLAGDTLETTRRQVTAELDAGRLRAAQRLVTELPADDPLRARVAAVEAQLAGLGRDADRELASGRTESAAERLADALLLARDDDALHWRLAELPPPRPGTASARMEGQHVVVQWTPSPARAGQVRYRIRRGLSRAPGSPTEATAVAAETGAHRVTDSEAPAGTEVSYSVFADRGGEACSPPAITPVVTFVPDVTDCVITEKESSVTVSWRAHPSTERVLAVRQRQHRDREPAEPGTADDGISVPATLAGFTDTELQTGTQYVYRITACYRAPSGQRRQSRGITVSAVPAPEPVAVTDLEVVVSPDSAPSAGTVRLTLSWTPPRHGQVRLVWARDPLPWPAGTRVPPGTAGLTDIPGRPQRGPDGRDVVEVSLPFGRYYFLVLTEAGYVVAGRTVELRLLEPVSGLVAARMHDMAQLSWRWPADATDVIVLHGGQKSDCSRRAYRDEGGFSVAVGRDQVFFAVLAVYPGPGGAGQLLAPAVRTSVPARPVRVTYSVRRRLRSMHRVVEVVCEETIQLPPLVIEQTTGRYPPEYAGQGEIVQRTERQPAERNRPIRIKVQLRDLNPGWLACFADPQVADPEAGPVLIFAPPEGQMRIP